MAESRSVFEVWLAEAPFTARDRLERLRALIHEVAADVDASPVIEEMKWGQPSYRGSNGNESTPVRLGWSDEGDVSLLVHCQTTVISDLRATVGDHGRFDGSRALVLGPGDPIDDLAAALITHALTYRR